MPDVFDEVAYDERESPPPASRAAPKDIFDEIEANGAGDIFDQIDSAPPRESIRAHMGDAVDAIPGGYGFEIRPRDVNSLAPVRPGDALGQVPEFNPQVNPIEDARARDIAEKQQEFQRVGPSVVHEPNTGAPLIAEIPKLPSVPADPNASYFQQVGTEAGNTVSGIANFASGIVNFLQSGDGALLLATGKLPVGSALRRSVFGTVAGAIVKDTPQVARELADRIKKGDTAGAIEQTANLLTLPMFAKHLGSAALNERPLTVAQTSKSAVSPVSKPAFEHGQEPAPEPAGRNQPFGAAEAIPAEPIPGPAESVPPEASVPPAEAIPAPAQPNAPGEIAKPKWIEPVIVNQRREVIASSRESHAEAIKAASLENKEAAMTGTRMYRDQDGKLLNRYEAGELVGVEGDLQSEQIPEQFRKPVDLRESQGESEPHKLVEEGAIPSPATTSKPPKGQTVTQELDKLAVDYAVSKGRDVGDLQKEKGLKPDIAVHLSNQIISLRKSIFHDLGLGHLDATQLADKKVALAKLKERMAENAKLVPTLLNEAGTGDTVSIHGNEFTVQDLDADGNIVMADKNGKNLRFHEDTPLAIDPDSYKKAPEIQAAEEPAAPVPKLRADEKGTGELLQGEDAPFNLTGEKGTDFERLAKEKADAEKAAAEAAEIEKKAQRTFFDENGPLEERLGAKGKSFDPFTADEGDLFDYFEEKFGDRGEGTAGTAFGRSGTFTFPSYEAFAKWMQERYAERDLDGMKLAFAEAHTANKIRYIKDNLKADAHLKAWITHLATGADLPKESPPVVRTTPRPTPTGRPSPGPAPAPGAPSGSTPPPRPGSPPPPPRAPTSRRKFDITALTQVFRQFQKFPTMNERLKRAYGRFLPASEAVELKSRLLWDTKLAERVLGHEIGHFIDYVIPLIGKGKQFAARLKPLYDFRGKIYEKKELRQQARDLSRDWRGSFRDGDTYRDSGRELFADFMSAMFNNPEWVNQKYPKLFDAFQDLQDAKPAFKSAYREIETWLQGGTMAKELAVQDRAAVVRTFDELTKPDRQSKASFMDRLKFGTLSLWGRAFEKEGKPRALGSSIADELEYNKMWAAKENALFADDFKKGVQPELEKVSPDPVEARARLLSYSKAVRTIGERRAAGRWIEDNPKEARELLQGVLDLDTSLNSKYGDAVETAPDSALYDLSAEIFREIHDRGEKYVTRIEREIDKMKLGVKGEAALMAFNVRGKLLNPGGLTPETARQVLKNLRDELGPDKFDALQRGAAAMRDLLFETQRKMHDEGLISDKTWKELIEPNKNNYVPFAVLDYFEGKVRAGVMPQKGTAKDVADVAAATQLKVAASNVWRQQQRQVQLLRDAYAKGGVNIPLGEELKRASEIDRIRRDHQNDDVSRAVLWNDGKPHLVEFPGDAGKLLEAAMENPSFYEHMSWIADASNVTHQLMQFYTQFSVPFMFFRNPIRGVRTAGLKVGFGQTAKQLLNPAEFGRNAALAKNYAEAAFGGQMLPEVREMVDRQALLPPHLSQAMVRDAENLRSLMENHTILANQVRGLGENAPKWWTGGKPGREVKILSQKLFAGYEAFEKIYNYQAALEKGLTPEQATAIARRGGIPKPGVGGKWSMAMEVWFPWTRVHMQGVRASYDMLRDPEMAKGFAARFVVSEALPRVAKVAIGTGVIGGAINWALNKDDDPKDSPMAEFMRRVSPYKMALDDTVPLYFYDPRTGKVHYIWEYKKGSEIPKHFEAVSFRIPASEEGRLWGTLLYNTMISAPGANDQLGKPGETFVTSLGNWAKNYMLPGVSQIIKTSSDLYDMVALGRNPVDSYRNQPAANEKLFAAGGADRAQAIAGYALNQGGSAGELAGVMAANFGVLDQRALNALSSRLPGDVKAWADKVPFLKSAISHDNYSEYRVEKMSQLEKDQVRAKARLIMSDDARSLYDFYYRNLKRKDKFTENEYDQFQASKYFVEKIWGDMTKKGEPTGYFFSQAAHAVGKDGSSEAKATIRRDLDAAAAPVLARFRELRKQL